jgi:hypothetical protein
VFFPSFAKISSHAVCAILVDVEVELDVEAALEEGAADALATSASTPTVNEGSLR